LSAVPLPLLVRGARALDLNLGADQLSRFAGFSRELLAWNEHMSLTAVTDPEKIQVKHFLDSLTLVPVLRQAGADRKRLVDIGSGNGLPGIAIAIAMPFLPVTLVEATGKKARFLRHAAERLGLDNVQVRTGRAEQLGHELREREAYDFATARAVGGAATLVELLTPFLCIGGLAILMKTEEAVEAEIGAAAQALTTLGCEVEGIRRIDLPQLERRVLVTVRKHAATPPEYPRRPGVPERRPIAF
jgi:16S rRNA (guanine527-N7)-methyltransferase